jgi:hypothetical protein
VVDEVVKEKMAIKEGMFLEQIYFLKKLIIRHITTFRKAGLEAGEC